MAMTGVMCVFLFNFLVDVGMAATSVIWNICNLFSPDIRTSKDMERRKEGGGLQENEAWTPTDKYKVNPYVAAEHRFILQNTIKPF